MHKILTLLLLACSLSAAGQTTSLEGELSDLQEVSEVLIAYPDSTGLQTDTITVKGGKFSWSKTSAITGKAMLFFPGNSFPFFIEPGSIHITGKTDSIVVTGSKVDAESRAFASSFDDLRRQKASLNDRLKTVGEDEEINLLKALDQIDKTWADRETAFIRANPDHVLSLSLAIQKAVTGHYEDARSAYNLLSEKARSGNQGKEIREHLKISEKTRIGATLPDFVQNDPDGRPVKFSSFRGKYVFLDFWASWCAPCRAENHNVLKAYNTFKDQNFTVIGISVDHEPGKWKKAIKDDNMPWTMVSDLKGMKNEIAAYFNVDGVPFTLLIDPDGKIIAKHLYGARLHQKLRLILGSKPKNTGK